MAKSTPVNGPPAQLFILVAIGLGCAALGVWTGDRLASNSRHVEYGGGNPTGLSSSDPQSAPVKKAWHGSQNATSDPNVALETGELRIPAAFLRAGYFPTIGRSAAIRDEIVEFLRFSEQEREQVSSALYETYKGFRAEFLAGAKLMEDEGGGEIQIQIKPVNAAIAASLHQKFESQLIEAVGKERAAMFRLLADEALRGVLAGFGNLEQLVVIREDDGVRYFDRYAIDPKSGKRRQSSLETGSWRLEADEQLQQNADETGTFFKRPLLELAGLW